MKSVRWSHSHTIVVALPHPALPPTHFKTTFRLKMGAGTGADGLSFSYGDISSAPIGELGGGRGLRVCLRTYMDERVEVWHDEKLLHVSSNESIFAWPSGHSLRSSQFVDVTVQYTSDGLTVAHKGVTHVDRLVIDAWQPRLGWRFAIGARAGGLSDDHHIDDLVIEAGAAISPEASPLAITLNGLQFTPSEQPFVYGLESAEAAGASVDRVGIIDS